MLSKDKRGTVQQAWRILSSKTIGANFQLGNIWDVMLVKYLVRYRYQLSLYANIRKAKECKGNEGKPIFCSGLLVFIWSSIVWRLKRSLINISHKVSTSLGALLVQPEKRCAKKIMVILFLHSATTLNLKNLEERSPLPFLAQEVQLGKWDLLPTSKVRKLSKGKRIVSLHTRENSMKVYPSVFWFVYVSRFLAMNLEKHQTGKNH